MKFPKICRHCDKAFTSEARNNIYCSLKCIVLANYKISGDCWEWTRAINSEGYGIIRLKAGSPLAHRTSYAKLKGKIPKGLYVLHTCDNRRCVNPEHLYCGTHEDNMRDMDSRGRRVILRAYGEDHHEHRFKESDIPVVRKLVADGASMRSVARLYDVSLNSVRKIISRETWAYIE